jgi:hypothetical protein
LLLQFGDALLGGGELALQGRTDLDESFGTNSPGANIFFEGFDSHHAVSVSNRPTVSCASSREIQLSVHRQKMDSYVKTGYARI